MRSITCSDQKRSQRGPIRPSSEASTWLLVRASIPITMIGVLSTIRNGSICPSSKLIPQRYCRGWAAAPLGGELVAGAQSFEEAVLQGSGPGVDGVDPPARGHDRRDQGRD